MNQALVQLMIHTITLEKLASAGLSGDKAFGAAVQVKARVENQTRLVRDGSGREVASNTFIMALPYDTTGHSVTFDPSDRITLPSGFTPSQPRLIAIARCDAEAGLHHWEIRA